VLLQGSDHGYVVQTFRRVILDVPDHGLDDLVDGCLGVLNDALHAFFVHKRVPTFETFLKLRLLLLRILNARLADKVNRCVVKTRVVDVRGLRTFENAGKR